MSRFRLPAEITLVLCVAIALRAYGIGEQSLWTDELFSRYYPDLFGLKFLWTTGFVHENSPPFYYMAVDSWMWLFGTSEAAIRSLSLTASVLALPLVYLIGRELFDHKRAILAALIFAVSPMQISFAQEARTYALLLIPISAAYLGIASFLGNDRNPRGLWLYWIGAVTAIYCHASAAFFIVACNLVVIPALFHRRPALTRWLLANAFVGLVILPVLVAMVLQGSVGSGLQWIPPFRPVHVIRALSPVIVGTNTPTLFPGAELSLALFALLAVTLFVAPPTRRALLVLAGIPTAFAALIALASLYNPIFITRVFCWFGVPLALLLAHAIAIPWRLRPVLVATTIVACIIGLYYEYAAPQKEPWREMLQELGPRLARADHVVLAPLTDPTGFAYYAPHLDNLLLWDAGPHGNIENGALAPRMGVPWTSREDIVRAIRSGGDVWLILRTPDQPLVDNLLTELPPPKERVERTCGKVVCIAALGWPRGAATRTE